MIGPPLAFMLALNYGFTTMFSIAAGIFVISLALIAIKLPSVPRVEQPSEEAAALAQAGGWQDKNVRMLFIASTLMWTCNTMYIIDMPLWISSDLGLPDSPGRDPDGHCRRAGDTGDDPRRLLRKALWQT